MARKAVFATCLSFFLGMAATGAVQAQTPSPFSLSLVPSFDLPVGSDAQAFKFGGGANLIGEYRMPFLPVLFTGIQAGYSYVPLNASTTTSLINAGSVSLIGAGALVGARLDFLGSFSARIVLGGGYYFGFINGGGASGSNPFASLGGNVSWNFTPALSLELGADFRDFFGTYTDVAVTLGLSYNFISEGASSTTPATVQEKPATKPTPLSNDRTNAPTTGSNGSNKGVVISDLSMNKVFPIFHAFYDNNPVGKLTITNTDTTPVTDITISLFIKRFMDAPKECAVIPALKPGESRDIDLLALFGDNILEVTQTTKVAAQVDVAYTRGGKPATTTKVETISVYDRNAMNWDDSQKAAAFVTPKEPVVMFFSNNVNAMAKNSMNRVMDKNLQTGMIFHDALRLYGISYVSPPLTSYAVVSQDKQAVDSLKFPRETFSYRSGDCSDLSILYCSLLESVQIETAFITVPGHIFMAFALDMPEDQARKTFTRTDELIFQGGKAWVPIEVTERETTFMGAWQEGAKEWRENVAKKQADFYPVRTAWRTYQAVFFPGSSTQPALPDANKIIIDFQGDLISLITREIGSKETELKATIRKTPDNKKAINSLGLLYARYDLADKAEAQFQTLASKSEFVPALLNLGNLSYLKGDYKKALSFYQRAYKQSPHNPNVLLCMARANHEQQNYGSVKEPQSLNRINIVN